jgi:hypothetical protein
MLVSRFGNKRIVLDRSKQRPPSPVGTIAYLKRTATVCTGHVCIADSRAWPGRILIATRWKSKMYSSPHKISHRRFPLVPLCVNKKGWSTLGVGSSWTPRTTAIACDCHGHPPDDRDRTYVPSAEELADIWQVMHGRRWCAAQ